MDILAITCMRNEGPHLVEWIAHHRAAGVGHFLICSNDCDDGTDTLLDALAQTGIVTHLPLIPRGKKTVQWQALKQAWDHPRTKAADWVLVIDSDEFVALRPPLATLTDLIDTLPVDTDALTMPWRLFGNSGQIAMDSTPTTERFTRAADEVIDLPLAHFFKTLFKPEKFRQPGVHRPKPRPQHHVNWVNCDGTPLPDTIAASEDRINLYGLRPATPLVQLNHYSLRAAENFMVKRARGLPNRTGKAIDLGYWTERNFNCVEDTLIAHMRPATARVTAELMAHPDVAEAHAQSVRAQRRILQDRLHLMEELRLFWHLVLSPGSTAPDPAETRAHLARMRAAHKAQG